MAYVYFLSNKPFGVLYIGVTGNLLGRMMQHRSGVIEGFTKKYNLKQLVYYEQFQYIEDALWREKSLKKWKRIWKLELISKHNPSWRDLVHVEP